MFARNDGDDVIALGSPERPSASRVPDGAKPAVDDLADGCMAAWGRCDDDHRRRSGYALAGADKARRAKLADEEAEAEDGDPFMGSLQNAAVTRVKVVGEIVEVKVEQRGQARREGSPVALLDAPRNERRVEDDRRARLATPCGIHRRVACQSQSTSSLGNHLLSEGSCGEATGNVA